MQQELDKIKVKLSLSNKCCPFELSSQRIVKKSTISTKYESAQTVFNIKIIINASWAANPQMSMISEGSYDTVE